LGKRHIADSSLVVDPNVIQLYITSHVHSVAGQRSTNLQSELCVDVNCLVCADHAKPPDDKNSSTRTQAHSDASAQ
jgi:hypothetical protein